LRKQRIRDRVGGSLEEGVVAFRRVKAGFGDEGKTEKSCWRIAEEE